ncbi:MAG: RecT family recombinase [Pseudomonadota bacterium]
MSNALQLVTGDIYAAKDGFMQVLTDKSINFEREAGFAIQVLQNNEYSLKAAMENRQAVVDAVTNIAAIGISLNPAKKQAYLVPRKGKICLDISYIGLLDLAIASNSIKWGQAELVREKDEFKLNGFDRAPIHNFNPFGKERGEIVGVYVVVKTHDGDYLTTTMTIDECYSIRDRSEAWKKGQSGPWKSDPGEMIKKTVIKRAYKLWPKTDRLDQAIHYLNTDGQEGITDFNAPAVRGDDMVFRLDWADVDALIKEALQTTTDAEALQYWKQNNARLANQPSDHSKLKNAIARHRDALRQADEARTVDAEPLAPQTDAAAEHADFVAGLDEGSAQ